MFLSQTAVRGVGIGLRHDFVEDLLATSRTVDWLEIAPENYLDLGGWRASELSRCLERWPIITHGIALSVGGPDPLNADYLTQLRALTARTAAPFFTDHACFARAGGHYFHDLLPVPFTEEAARWLGRRAREAAERVERPILLENITYYAEMPGSRLNEGEFLRAVLEDGGAGLLLDLNNVYVNAVNHGRSPREVLWELPVERTAQIHLAGHIREGEILLDNHGAAVCDEVWQLYRDVIKRIGPVPTLIEWDTDIPPLDRVLDEADRARALLEEASLDRKPTEHLAKSARSSGARHA